MKQIIASTTKRIHGNIHVPGDKSISHRALMLGAWTAGTTHIRGLLESNDIASTINALKEFGAKIYQNKDNSWRVEGVGLGGLHQPKNVLNLGNSGTGVRLAMGLAATQSFTTFFTGDNSLISRPMARIIEPLSLMGATFKSTGRAQLPIVVTGAEPLMPIRYEMPLPSAQVKSAILLSALGAKGESIIIEPIPTRDYTEQLLKRFGANISTKINENGHNEIKIIGEPELKQTKIDVPGDPSSAAFLIVAALITPDSKITIKEVGMNHFRTGLFDVLTEMGGNLTIENYTSESGEPIADITASSSNLHGTAVKAAYAPRMIDEYPILAVAAAFASGETRLEGLEELKVKESNRLTAIKKMLGDCGVKSKIEENSLTIEGKGGLINGGGTILAPHDHRIAMSGIVLGLISLKQVLVKGTESIETSFPNFFDLLAKLGANVSRT